MRLIAKSNDSNVNIAVDEIERQEDIVYAYRREAGSLTANTLVGIFSIGSLDYLYLSTEKREGI